MGIVEQYLLQLKNKKRRFRITAAILAMLSLFVVVEVSWSLRMIGITIANDATCGCQEHQHVEECLESKVLICEEQNESQSGHVHTDACYQNIYKCNYEEHIHDISCYSDETADIETKDIWEASLPEMTGVWSQDLVSIAQSQLGQSESEKNFVLAEDGINKIGITRYGQWYGNPYGDWSSMFMMFCLHYADISQDVIPISPGVNNMMNLSKEADIFVRPNSNLNQKGNILFLDTDANETADKLVIINASEDDKLFVIGGDLDNTVKEVTLSSNDPSILGYLDINKLQELYQMQQDSDQPIISLDVQFYDDTFSLIGHVMNVEKEMYEWQWQYSEDGNEPWIDIEGANDLVYTLENTDENSQRYYRLQGYKVQMMLMTLSLDEEESDSFDDSILTSEPIAPFSIIKNKNSFTIDVYAYPIDDDGQRINDLEIISLGSFTVSSTAKTAVNTKFNTNLGDYQSAFFGSLTEVSADNIKEVYRSYSWGTYYLSYRKTDNSENKTWLKDTDSSISLYLRYKPKFTVTFESEFHTSISETVSYNECPTTVGPNNWAKEGYRLLGFTKDENDPNVYTYEEIMKMPIKANVTYTAKWANDIKINFNLGEYEDATHPIEEIVTTYGSTVPILPTPSWINNAVAMAFDGWYLNPKLTQEVTSDYVFYEDTILYAKWKPKDEGYYVYFMDFAREGQTPLVLMTHSVTEGQTSSPYVPGNAPEGKDWDGKWYLDNNYLNAYDFSIPVSQMTDYLTGVHNRDLYLYPGTQDVCKAIFVTYGTRVDPITVPYGGTIDLDAYVPKREGYEFAGWTLENGTPVSGIQTLTETTTYIAKWNAGYVSFEAILRIENANDTNMTQADILGTWYAKAGSQIRVNSTYSGSGDNRKGTHNVVCVLDGVEYPVYTNAALTKKATLNDVYEKYFIYNNAGTTWTDEVNWDDVFISGEVPYSLRPISSMGDTIINFDYMRVRSDIVFTIPNSNSSTLKGGYMDVYKLYQDGIITGSVTYTQTVPTSTGKNVSATGVSAENIRWSYTAATSVGDSYKNYYTLHDMKYGQRIFEVYPVGGRWLTPRDTNSPFHQYAVESGALFSSRRQDLTADFFTGTGRAVRPYSLVTEFRDQEYIALMYAIECLEGETADFYMNNVGYKVVTELCEVVKHTGHFGIKSLDGCEAGKSVLGMYGDSNKYYMANTITSDDKNYATNMSTAKIGDTSVYTLFAEKYWPYYASFSGVESVKTFDKAYIFYYNRLHMDIQFNFGYDSNGDGSNEVLKHNEIAYGERIDEYQFGLPNYEKHELLDREGYEFVGWLDSNGFVLEAEDWDSLIAVGDSESNTMIFIAKWEKISNNIVEYYEDRSVTEPFESHYFDDGELVEYPTMTAYPQGWVWQMYGEGLYERYDWDVPMYGEYGVQETRVINGEEVLVNVIRIYGTWDDSHTKVIYDPNAPLGGIIGTQPTDNNEYTIWQSEVPVTSRGNTANTDPEMVFVGWQLDRNGIVYQPGDHVPVQWPRTMIFTAQWAKPENVVYLRYDPNGGTPKDIYPNESGLQYMKNATALVWDNETINGDAWFSRAGYTFVGWNTEPNGTGTAYPPESTIVLTEPVTTLYAQWESDSYTLSLYKVDSENDVALEGAKFGLYKKVNGTYLLIDSYETGVDGRITFLNLEMDALYKIVEEKAPNGYVIINKEIFFGIKPNDNLFSLVFYDSKGNQISAPDGISGIYVTGTKLLTLTVENLRGYVLPSTGGTGIYLNILCGLILVLMPLAYVFNLRRKYGKGSLN